MEENKVENIEEPKEMIERRSWDEFRETGLPWYVNQIMQVFGWSLAFDIDEEGKIKEAFPVRTKFRGFSDEVINRNTKKLTQYMIDNGKELLMDADE